MGKVEDALKFTEIVAASSPMPLTRLKFKARKMKYTDDMFLEVFDCAIDKGWIEEFGDGIRITERGREEAGSAGPASFEQPDDGDA